MSTTWILVANASRARLYENSGINKGLRLLSKFEHPESRLKGCELVSDRPGFMQSSGNGHGSRQPAMDPKQNEAERFAQEIARTLELGRGQSKYQRLILVAGSPFLGTLRSHLSDQVLARISDVLEKDYTQSKEGDIGRYLEHCIYL